MSNDRLAQTNYYLKQKIIQHLPQADRKATAIPGLMLSRHDNDSPQENCFYRPMIALVVQGFKRSMIGNEEFNYGKNHFMVVSVDLPGSYHITDASPELPFISISIKLDKHIISQLLTEMPIKPTSLKQKPASQVSVAEVSLPILESFLRLVDLLDEPENIQIIAPMIIKELHYYLLCSPVGESLRLANSSGTKINQISTAIDWLRNNYAKPLDIEQLAKLVNMSSSTFHRHFRQVTTFSPLQFQKQLRLYEAERLMLVEGKDVKTVAFQVGYESPSQFSREYKRQFGEAPHRDMLKKRS
ncbi:AraC family transcriptional regulator [Gilliamella sp. wkB178]|uniref:AraC family transcriptional regulator n=1 Tax=Gilliamella sp. wkB178 TaxID=3120259 RepID=UPI00080E9946|nr:AraC family transcriptional regulator [Gilliamella apicola]OCG08733.1 AraC family transcriptional regulator [Gilliamella apicola]